MPGEGPVEAAVVGIRTLVVLHEVREEVVDVMLGPFVLPTWGEIPVTSEKGCNHGEGKKGTPKGVKLIDAFALSEGGAEVDTRDG